MSKPFDLLSIFAQFGLARKVSLRDPKTLAAFIDFAGNEVESALADSALLHGQRTEAMFEALLVSLGEFELLKAENAGRLNPETRYSAPDFRVVLKGGEHWLIEVKNVYKQDPSHQNRRLFSGSALQRLTAYAQATGADLKIAVFWARWSIWTLVSPERLVAEDGGLSLDMFSAIRLNELSRLGDRTLGTLAPLRLRLVMDQACTNSVDADGTVVCKIGGVQMYCADRELTEPEDKEIAWLFMRYGGWTEREPELFLDGDRLLAIEFQWEPEEPTGQGFEIVESLSRMFARYYAAETLELGKVLQLHAAHRPAWLKRLVNGQSGGKDLPLWQFVQEPNYDWVQGEVTDGTSS